MACVPGQIAGIAPRSCPTAVALMGLPTSWSSLTQVSMLCGFGYAHQATELYTHTCVPGQIAQKSCPTVVALLTGAGLVAASEIRFELQLSHRSIVNIMEQSHTGNHALRL